jgi:hypothetical protein
MNQPVPFFSFDIIIHLKGQNSKAFIFYKQNSMMKGMCMDIACVCCWVFFFYIKLVSNWTRARKKSLKIPKGGNQNPYIEEEQTTQ